MLRSDCDFCKEFAGDSENSFRRTYAGNPESRILLRSGEFAVIPSLGQIFEGYLLLLPIRHFRALGDLPSPAFDDFVRISELVGKVLKETYGKYVLFEHGTRTESGGCGIYHAHLHAVPLVGIPDPVNNLKSEFPSVELAHLNELSEQSSNLATYLFYRDSNHRLYIFDSGPLPSQYMRKLLAESLETRDWDWRTAGREERLLATLDRLSGKFETEAKGSLQL